MSDPYSPQATELRDLRQQIASLQQENARLNAEVVQLRMAGVSMRSAPQEEGQGRSSVPTGSSSAAKQLSSNAAENVKASPPPEADYVNLPTPKDPYRPPSPNQQQNNQQQQQQQQQFQYQANQQPQYQLQQQPFYQPSFNAPAPSVQSQPSSMYPSSQTPAVQSNGASPYDGQPSQFQQQQQQQAYSSTYTEQPYSEQPYSEVPYVSCVQYQNPAGFPSYQTQNYTSNYQTSQPSSSAEPVQRMKLNEWDFEFTTERDRFHALAKNDGPLEYVVKAIEKVQNQKVDQQFLETERRFITEGHSPPNAGMGRQVVYHGTNPKNYPEMLRHGILAGDHRQQSESGWFAAGAFFSKRPTSVMEYFASGSFQSIEAGQTGNLLRCEIIPGREWRVVKLKNTAALKQDYDSHVSTDDQDYVITNPQQIVTRYVITFEARQKYS